MSEYMRSGPAQGAAPKSSADGPDSTQDTEQLDLLAEGERLRDRGTRAAELNTWSPYRQKFLGHIEALPAGTLFTSDDVIAAVGLPIASSKNALGGLITAAAKQGLVEPVGFQKSRRTSRHGSWIRQWRRTS